MAMVFLKIVSILLLTQSIFAKSTIVLKCAPEGRCKNTINYINKIQSNEYSSREVLLNDIKKIGIDEHVSFMAINDVDQNTIQVIIEKRPLIRDIIIKAEKKIDEESILKMLQISAGESYYLEDKTIIEKRLSDWLYEDGYRDVKVRLKSRIKDEKVTVEVDIRYGETVTLSKVTADNQNNKLLKELLKSFYKKIGKNYNQKKFRQMIKNLYLSLKDEGYLNSIVNFKEEIMGVEKRIGVKIKVVLGNRYQFTIHGNEKIDGQVIKEELLKDFNSVNNRPSFEVMKGRLNSLYNKIGFYNNDFQIDNQRFKTFEGTSVISYIIHITEGHRYKLKAVNFLGNTDFSIKVIKDFFKEKSSTLVARGYLDESFFVSFKNLLKEFYIRKGFIFTDVLDAEIIKEKKSAVVNYFIKERQRSRVGKIFTRGVNESMRNKILKNIVNKEGLPLNILELEKDITRAVTTLRDVGYFYAKFKNKNQNSIVKYQSNFTQADIYLDFDPGKLLRADEFIYVGNIVTKKIVLERELDIKVGDVVTPEKIKSIRDSLNSLGVFSKVSVLTSVTNLHNNDEEYKARLVVKLRERALGRVEIAPGYRTDLGAKFSFSFFKNNLWGLNHSFNTRLLLNRRFTFDELDQKRLGTNREHEIEGLAKVTYSWPYLFNSVNFDANITFQRRRFYSFDADIIRISPQFSKQFNKYFATSLKYQFEQIRQHRASNIDNNATFRIGGLTSAITLDFRDNRISPRSGSYYGLSWEFANPYFGSLKDENIEINFSKLISRNRFYLPFFNKKLVFALSISGGYQRNYATDTIASGSGGLKSRGYIPSIKVFRLDGYDLVRGFADSEINRLDSGEDISQTRIEGSAYFTNIKFEPRYYVSDNFVLGFFADAGRIFVNNYKPSDLRTAVGLSFKLLTPVGTLDFDYGVKTRRKLFSSFREDFGRFHLNIGTF